MKPTRDLVLIKADRPKEKTKSGLYIAEEWHSLPLTGIVLELGPQAERIEYVKNGRAFFVKPGDRVMFDRYASIILEGDERICKQSHLMGVFE